MEHFVSFFVLLFHDNARKESIIGALAPLYNCKRADVSKMNLRPLQSAVRSPLLSGGLLLTDLTPRAASCGVKY